jgi:hypothetical protein
LKLHPYGYRLLVLELFGQRLETNFRQPLAQALAGKTPDLMHRAEGGAITQLRLSGAAIERHWTFDGFDNVPQADPIR